jgi:hypothetical protein
MANDGLINLLGWCKRERESLQMQREMLQSGKFRIFKDEGSGQIDVTTDSVARIATNIVELDLILADCDSRSSSASQAIPIEQLNASNDE